MENRKKHRLVDRLESASPDRVLSIVCSDCQGSLEVGYSSIGKTALHVSCPTCGWKVISDGLPEPPPWVAVLGPKIRTKQRPRVDAPSTKA
jgi:DNA-directed RNA polymerase subunit RPC12/RpoP